VARIPYPDYAFLSPALRERFERASPLNVTHMMSHNEGVMAAVSRLGSELLVRGSLPPDLRELVIVRIGRLCRSAYEAHQHEAIARGLGVSDAKLHALAGEDRDGFSVEERLALRFVEELHAEGAVSEAAMRACSVYFSDAQLVELCIVAGFYIMIAGFLGSFDVEIETTARESLPGMLGRDL
jgi:alkylhydroperoxidase family enzyme